VQQAAVDSTGLATLRHAVRTGTAPLPLDSERITFTQLRAAASFHPVAFRAFWKLMFMLCQPTTLGDGTFLGSAAHIMTGVPEGVREK
jgi:hypothetical protein